MGQLSNVRVSGLLIVALSACSPSPGEPTLPAGADGKPVSRTYAYECPLPVPGKTSGPSTFEGIYTEIVSDKTGVARCQNGACHGAGAVNGSLALGVTKKDAFCGMTSYVLIQPHDCSSCDFCADEIKKATPGACGDDAGIDYACCVPCGATTDGGTDGATSDSASSDGSSEAATDGASEAASVDETPIEVSGLYTIVTPDRKGAIRMPKVLCSNRTLDANDLAGIRAWGRAGAPLD